MEAFVLTYITEFTYIGIFAFLMLTVFGFPFPEDAVLLLSGAVVAQGVTSLMPTLTIAYVGVVTGDLILYYIGRKYGIMLVHHKRFGKVLTPERLKRAGKWFHRWGNALIFWGRHLVGVRAQIFLCAGVFKLSARRVIAYDSASAFVGVPVMVGLGYVFGKNLPAIRHAVASGHWAMSIAALGLAGAWVLYRVVRGRRTRPQH
ncbi:MAG: DedA family protein [Nitrospirae bacterium]|nr:DedA family protein [Nitrospirota bacterium]MBI5696530.1 DedA family protein [Nitrospirota bacterium]